MTSPPKKINRAYFFDAFAARPRPLPEEILRPEAGHEGERLHQLLAANDSMDLSPADIGTEVEGNLWALTAKAFRYYLPAFLHAALNHHEAVSVFASELIGALTEPARDDVAETFDRAAQIPPEIGLPEEMIKQLRKQQLDYFDSGAPSALFHARFDDLAPAEGAAIIDFLTAFQEAHGEDFPFGELEIALERWRARYREK